MRILFFIVIFSFFLNNGFGQNLVPNPGFEEYYICPQSGNTNKTNNKIAPHWNSPSYGTPDLYNTCSSHKMGTQNITGVTNPYKGNGFAGIMTWEERKGYREYLQVELLELLKDNQPYIISYRYKLSTYSKYCIDRIGFSLTDSSFFYKQDSTVPISPAYSKIKPQVLDQYTGTWEVIEKEYIAKGGERYLTIGNFDNNSKTKATHLAFVNTQEPMLEHAAYYYVDDVSIFEKKLPSDSTTQSQDTMLTILNNKMVTLLDFYTLSKVLFDHDSYKLTIGSYNELNEIIAILNKCPDWKIKILGHTDNMGSDQYNLTLSEKRTYAVKDYLILNGISKERIQTKGYGKSKPIVAGFDEKSKKINRRVEVQFYR